MQRKYFLNLGLFIFSLSLLNGPAHGTNSAAKEETDSPQQALLYKSDSHNPRLVIKIPTRSRPERFFAQLDTYYKKLSGRIACRFIITADEDDLTMNNDTAKARLSLYPNLSYHFGTSSSKIEAYNSDLSDLSDNEILLAVGDDMQVVVDGYDQVIVNTMLEHFPDLDGVLNFHDGFVGAEVNTYPIVGAPFYRRFGYLFNRSYRSLFANEELALVSRILGKEARFEQVLIKHNHPVFGLAPWDDLYTRNEHLKPYDSSVFKSRRSQNFYLDKAHFFPKMWSILISPFDGDQSAFQVLYDTIKEHIALAGVEDDVEVLLFDKDTTSTSGQKRNSLIAQSKGKYISFVETDFVHPDYVKLVYEKLLKNPDCVILSQNGSPNATQHYHLNLLRHTILAQFLFDEKSNDISQWAAKLAQSNLLKKEEKLEISPIFHCYDGKCQQTDQDSDAPLLHYYCTAADTTYFLYVLHLIGSIHAAHFDQLGEIAIANIGLLPEHIEQLNSIEKVRVFEVEKANPDIITPFVVNQYGKTVPGLYSWKPIAIKQTLEWYPYVLWIDSSSLVLQSIDSLFKHIKQNGYFLSTIGNEMRNGKFGHPVSWSMTKRLIDTFNLNNPNYKWILDSEQVMATTFGISRQGATLFEPFFAFPKNLDLFVDDGTTPTGFGAGRHDQALLSIFAYINKLKVHKQDHTQKKPIVLSFDAKEEPFYITWHMASVDHRTGIYNARADALSYGHFLKSIRYKNRES